MKKQSFLLILIAMLSLSSAHAHIEVSNYWARLVPNGMGALYLEIKNSHTEPDVLIRASSPNAKSLMIHETQRKDNITSMKHRMKGLDIPANGSLSLKPGSYHIMIAGLDKNLKLGDKIEVSLEFKKSEKITLQPILKIKPPTYTQ